MQQGAPLNRCWGFIDGTARPIARPSQDQRITFSGHKRVHAIKFQSIQLPNGITAHMYGPIEGRRHDSGILTESGILTQLENFTDETGEPYHLFGDAGYPLRPQLLCPFKGVNLTPQEIQFNKDMSKVRECIEWGFGEIVNQFALLDFKKKP